MKASKFSEAQFAYVLKQAQGDTTIAEVCREVGYPQSIRVDNGSEFISLDMDLWAYSNNVILDFSCQS